MNKISLYLFLILVYLGLSKSFSPTEQSIPYIHDSTDLARFFPEAPLSLILIESFQTGFLIHTYFHRYKAIYVFKESEEFVVRTSEPFWKKNLPHLGLSLLRRNDTEPYEETTTPVPPGSLFVGHAAYGSWETQDSGQRIWVFHNAYKNFPDVFYWGEFTPTEEFHTTLEAHLKHDIPFLGLNKEFGTEGTITKQFFDPKRAELDRFGIRPWEYLAKLFQRSNPSELAPSLDEAQPIPIEEVRPFLGERPQEKKSEPSSSIFNIPSPPNNTEDQDE